MYINYSTRFQMNLNSPVYWDRTMTNQLFIPAIIQLDTSYIPATNLLEVTGKRQE
jgi:hypothetical protein